MTTAIGALMGVVFGAIVGRVIAMFGDATIETSVPMIFCATLGYFVGGTTSAKGSLDRFGSTRSALGATVTAVALILLVGGASLARSAGVVVVLVGLLGTVVAGVAATAVGKPNAEPIPTPTPVSKAKAAEPEPAKPEPAAAATPDPTPPRAAAAARRVRVEPDPEPLPTPPADLEAEENWRLDDEAAEPVPKKSAAVKQAADPSPPARPRRDRPLRKGDS